MDDFFEGLYRQHGGSIFSFLYGMVGDRHEAEDLTQETFVRALGAAERFQARALPKTWLLTIARNLAINHLKSRARRSRHKAGAPEGSPAAAGSPAGDAEIEETAAAIRAAVAELAPKHAEVFMMKVVDGLTYKEIAGIVGCPVGTVQSRMFYAVRRLRRELRAQGGGDDL